MKIIICRGRNQGDVHIVEKESRHFYKTVEGLIFSKHISKPLSRAKEKVK